MKDNKFVLGLLLGLTFFLLMGAFTRDWNEAVPTDSTVANQIDDYNRYLRVDTSDRLKEMIYGFTASENSGYPGFKELIFKQQSSAPGTTNADEITLYSIDDGSNCGLYVIQENGYTKQLLKKVGSDINFVIETADIPADLIDSVHYAANSIDPEHLVDDFTFDTFPLSPSAAPDADYELANKKYVDDRKAYIKLVDSKATTTDGGTFTSGAWQKRTVAEETDSGSHCSVSSSVIVLAAGTYECRISCPGHQVNLHQTRLRNTTAGTTILVGTAERAYIGSDGTDRSFIVGRFTIAASQNLEIQHKCSFTFATSGFGVASGSGEAEIYTIAEFWKI